jgi:REP element-mobilizing transposase RayT
MSQYFEPLKYGKYYRIHNRTVGKENFFREIINYEPFLGLYDKYIEPLAETYVWCLTPNHFHLLVRIKEEEEIDYLSPKKLNPEGSGKPLRRAKGKGTEPVSVATD